MEVQGDPNALNHFNEQVLAYEPELDQIFLTVDSGEYQRMIFYGHELRDKEENQLDEFREYAKKNGV